jgi:hypothetical protein
VFIKLQLTALAKDANSNGQLLAAALGMLVRAYQYAQDTRIDRWQFAVPIREFRYAGVTISELRWLLHSGFAVHAKEVTDPIGPARRFSRLEIHSIPPHACFVLSDKGIRLFAQTSQTKAQYITLRLQKSSPKSSIPLALPGEDKPILEDMRPIWYPHKRELQFRGLPVKIFRSTAPNQERILAAFQEERWSRRVDEPLPPQIEQDSRERLRSAIKQLNRNQDNNLLRFCGDGSGRGILWQSLV